MNTEGAAVGALELYLQEVAKWLASRIRVPDPHQGQPWQPGNGDAVKITDEMVERAGERMWNLHAQVRGWEELADIEQDQMRHEARSVLEAAFAVMPQRFCTATLNCRLADGHKGVCPR